MSLALFFRSLVSGVMADGRLPAVKYPSIPISEVLKSPDVPPRIPPFSALRRPVAWKTCAGLWKTAALVRPSAGLISPAYLLESRGTRLRLRFLRLPDPPDSFSFLCQMLHRLASFCAGCPVRGGARHGGRGDGCDHGSGRLHGHGCGRIHRDMNFCLFSLHCNEHRLKAATNTCMF